MSFLPGRGRVDTNNTTTVNLGAAATFTGAWTEVTNYASISIIGAADVAGTLYGEFSTDGATVARTIQLSSGLDGNFGIHDLIPVARYFRVRVVNGAAPQGSFDLQTIVHNNPRVALPTSRLVQSLDDYSDVLNTRAALFGKQANGDYVDVAIGERQSLTVSVRNPTTSLGEIRNAEIRPVSQIDAVYGIDPGVVETFVDPTPGTGSVDAVNGNFRCQTGVGVGGYGVIRSRRGVRYRPGQGSLFRFTTIFDPANAVANSLQIAGPFNTTNGYLVGYDGTQFGVMHRTDGRHEVRTLTITAAASAAETANITLNGVLYAVPLSLLTIPGNAWEIEQWFRNPANQTVWDAFQNGNTVVFFGRNAASLPGVYSVTSTGTFAGNIVQNRAGVANTETWTYQAAFNRDRLDGTGPSGMTIDKSLGNVFEVDMQYLGYGQVQFSIEDPNTGHFFPFHEFEFPNTRTTPTLLNPVLKPGWAAASLGSNVNITVQGASALGGIDGVRAPLKRPLAFSFQRASVGATLTSIFAVRVKGVINSVVQLSEMFPKLAYVSPEGSKAAEVKVLLNPTFSGQTNWTNATTNVQTIVEVDTTGTTFTSVGVEVASFVVAGGTSQEISFDDLAVGDNESLFLARDDVLVIAARITGGAGSPVTASLTWVEE